MTTPAINAVSIAMQGPNTNNNLLETLGMISSFMMNLSPSANG